MEKIHSAIQKARKERDARTSTKPLELLKNDAPAPLASDPSTPAPDAGAEFASPPDHDVKAAWAALAQYRPDRRALQSKRIVAFESNSTSACFDVLRTNILRQMRANGWKRLAITSPTPGCGKTTTSLNLGFSLGRLHDLRTMIIEADLRRPAIRGCLNLKSKLMFGEFLDGTGKAEDHLVRFGQSLAFGCNHGPMRNSAELLASQRISLQLAELDRLYAADITIFDMTPMLVSDDTIAFLPNVDCTLLIAASGVTTTAQVDRCERALAEQTNVLGVVLNKCQFMAADENYGYDYY